MSCLVLEMSSQVKDVMQAMDIARKAAEKAGLVFYTIISTKRQDVYWLVELSSLIGNFIIKINGINGEVIEFGPAK